jgi:hypothetical protein
MAFERHAAPDHNAKDPRIMANSLNTTIASRKRLRLTGRRWLAIGFWALCALAAAPILTETDAERQAYASAERERHAALSLRVSAIASLRAKLRDPDSLVVDRVFHRPGRGEVCVAYRARNGFGAMDRGAAVVIGDYVDNTGPNPYRNKVSGNWEVYCSSLPGLAPVEELTGGL